MGWEDSWQNLTYPLGMCVVLTHNRCGVHMMRTQPLKELISTAILLGFFMPCSRLTQPRLTQKPCSCHYLATSYTSRTTLDFPFSVIVVNGRRTNFPKTTAKKLSVVILFFTINQIHLSFRKDFLWGGAVSEFPRRKGQLLSWKGCSVATIHFGKGHSDVCFLWPDIHGRGIWSVNSL